MLVQQRYSRPSAVVVWYQHVEQYIVFTATLEHAAISVTLETTHLPLAFLPHHRPPAGFQLNHLNAPTFSNCSSPPRWKFQSVDVSALSCLNHPHSQRSSPSAKAGDDYSAQELRITRPFTSLTVPPSNGLFAAEPQKPLTAQSHHLLTYTEHLFLTYTEHLLSIPTQDPPFASPTTWPLLDCNTDTLQSIVEGYLSQDKSDSYHTKSSLALQDQSTINCKRRHRI